MNAVQKLRQLADDIRAVKHPLRLRDDWALAGRLAERLGADRAEVARVVKAMDAEGLDRIVARIEGRAQTPPAPPPTPEPDAPAFTSEDKAAAMRAFKKRLKLTRLGEESKLGGRQLTSGRRSEVDAILPPEQYPRAMWEALVADGRLVYTGQGFYALARTSDQ